MSHYAKTVFTMEIRKLISYRSDFWINFIGQTIFSLCLYYFLWKSIFEYKDTQSMGGLNLTQMILYYLVAPLSLRVIQGEGIGHLAREIYDGNLNKYLLYPVNYFVYKLASYMSYSIFYIFQLCIILGPFYWINYDDPSVTFTLSNFILYLIAILISSIFYFFLSAITELISFWAENIWSLGVIVRFLVGFLGGAMIPLSFFPDWAQEILNYTPFPYLISFPVKLLMGQQYHLTDFLGQLSLVGLWGGVFFLISYAVWRKGNKTYSGVGI